MNHSSAFTVLLLLMLFQCGKPQDCSQSQQFDRTLEAGATGASVVEATISRITESRIFSDDFGFLRRMASFETDNGATATPGGGGIWKVSATVFDLINSFIRVPLSSLPQIEDRIEQYFCFRWSNTVGNSRRNLDVPLYSALAVMMAMNLIDDDRFPEDIPSQARLWRDRFNPLGNADEFISHANSLEMQGNTNIIGQVGADPSILHDGWRDYYIIGRAGASPPIVVHLARVWFRTPHTYIHVS